MPPFKPLTATKSIQKKESSETPVLKTPQEVSERLHIIYDDSCSMGIYIQDRAMQKSTQELAAEATADYLRNCKPHDTAVEVAPLNAEIIPLTAYLPKVAAQVKKIEPSGRTPLYRALGQAIDKHPANKYTHITIFTDGEATDYSYFNDRPTLFEEAKELGIPIDLIIISGRKDVSKFTADEQKWKAMVDSTGGTFLICADGKAFREKMKYFAPTLRHMLPAIASKES